MSIQASAKPILFSGEMIRALLDGRKTQTRRIFKLPKGMMWYDELGGEKEGWLCGDKSGSGWWQVEEFGVSPRGGVGDLLWCRETTCIAPKFFATPDESCVADCDGHMRFVSYKADGHPEDAMRDYKLKWTPSIHVPRWASRITLELTGVKVERLQDISVQDVRAEGVEVREFWLFGADAKGRQEIASLAFKPLWDSINTIRCYGWDANPWVWVLQFKVHKMNIDQFLRTQHAGLPR